jgi:hypothetical protein
VDARNRDDLLKKKENLEAYLLDNPQSSLYAWYARQNMEASELDRALKICRLGIQEATDKGIYHKLMGEIHMAKGDVTQAMQHFVECILTREPFPGVIIEVIKNFSDTLSLEQVTFLIKLLNHAAPGHPQVKSFYKNHPEVTNLDMKVEELSFLQDLAINLQQSSMVEVVAEEEEIPTEMPLDLEETTVSGPPNEESQAEPDPELATPKAEKLDETPPPVSPPRKPLPKKDPAVRHNITRSMATFTLMQIFKSQGMYENALEVLQLLREKSSNLERIEKEEKELHELLAGNTPS